MNWKTFVKRLLIFLVVLFFLIALWRYSHWYEDYELSERIVGVVIADSAAEDAVKNPQEELPVTKGQDFSITDGQVMYTIEDIEQKCIEASHLDNAKFSPYGKNSRYLYDQYRKIIPEQSLDGHLSHCWKASYSVRFFESSIEGYLGNREFDNVFKKKQSARDTRDISVLHHLRRAFPALKFESDIMCVPNVFMAGFPKCGSTYLYCVITKLIDYATKRPKSYHEILKEPHFWVSADNRVDVRIPTSGDIFRYFLNFLPGLQKHSDFNQSQILLVDGSPNMFFKWPRFRPGDDITNYCLIPSVLPNLLPNSKYIVIMRNPVKMMYSAFWFSCTSRGIIPSSVQRKGPILFHNRVMEKLNIFNKCMIDTTVPELNYTCTMNLKRTYTACIMKRLHLLNKCIHQINFNNFSPELPGCGRTRLAMGVYYVHIKKWLTVVAKERFLFLTLEDLVQHSNTVMRNVLEFLGQKGDSRFDSTVNRIKNSCYTSTNSQDSVDYKKNPKLRMKNETATLLNIFFHPFNLLLNKLTNTHNSWNEDEAE